VWRIKRLPCDSALAMACRAFEEETIQSWEACSKYGLPWAIWAGAEITRLEIAQIALEDGKDSSEAN